MKKCVYQFLLYFHFISFTDDTTSVLGTTSWYSFVNGRPIHIHIWSTFSCFTSSSFRGLDTSNQISTAQRFRLCFNKQITLVDYNAKWIEFTLQAFMNVKYQRRHIWAITSTWMLLVSHDLNINFEIILNLI